MKEGPAHIIIELRKAKGLTQAELADICGVGLRTIQRIESGVVTPRSYTLKKIFASLNFDYFKNDENHNPQMNNGMAWIHRFTNTKWKALLSYGIILLFVSIGVSILYSLSVNETVEAVEGWFKTGNMPANYTTGIDKKIVKSGQRSAYLASTNATVHEFGTLMQTCNATPYAGKRVKMTASIKCRNVKGWSGMWLRADERNSKKMLAFDNMQNRPLKGDCNWNSYQIILDIPVESATLNYGVLLCGPGMVWFDNVKLEIVDSMAFKVTNTLMHADPANTNFEK